ncbi:SdpI family protein [Arthrobacter sp. AQ5-05]|uniref:SdpI family protein n=1 Tax=Arthrobacter sp. AQ5-05 TaxID=2184581 RepID=UPI0012B60A54|nr:SdpI family protein [Arthrobacter sp. AQ5-05]
MIFAVLILLACYLLLIFVIVRCADGRIGINGIAGIRTPSMMTNEETWRAGHKAAKRPSLVGIYAAMICMIPALFVQGEEAQGLVLLASCMIMFTGVMVGTVKGTKVAKLVLATQH